MSFATLHRRGSQEHGEIDHTTIEVSVDETIERLLCQEDTDHDGNITVEDCGPKVFVLPTADSAAPGHVTIHGTYMLANLLQELVIQKDRGSSKALIKYSSLAENPVHRISRRITDMYWVNLTRRMDRTLVPIVAKDEKDWTDDPRPRIYVPHNALEQYMYYVEQAEADPGLRLEVMLLPEGGLTANLWAHLSSKPGILALDMRMEQEKLLGMQYVVPGGRFNEFYGWDSYFCALGLMESGRIDIVRDIALNFCFEIDNYGCILNANRSYYLGRSQPPFLTDLAVRLYQRTKHDRGAKDFLRRMILSAMKEYHRVWMCEPRYDRETGLSRYRPNGFGIPPECEESQFDHVISSFAEQRGLSNAEFKRQYNSGAILSPELDMYFLHDRAARESGHDTCYRFEGKVANLVTIDLNSLLYKYETDIAWAIKEVFDDTIEVPAKCGSLDGVYPTTEGSSEWYARAELRRARVRKYLWNCTTRMYHDYDVVAERQNLYESVTCFWAMWSGLATEEEASEMVAKALPKFEAVGGLTCTTAISRGPQGPEYPVRQWDYPSGWAPHQILAWDGLLRYDFTAAARRVAYRWLNTITQTAVDYNGTIVEKYDVTIPRGHHKVHAEYGNQGVNFRGLAKEGFGWTNASYLYGLKIIGKELRVALALGSPVEAIGHLF